MCCSLLLLFAILGAAYGSYWPPGRVGSNADDRKPSTRGWNLPRTSPLPQDPWKPIPPPRPTDGPYGEDEEETDLPGGPIWPPGGPRQADGLPPWIFPSVKPPRPPVVKPRPRPCIPWPPGIHALPSDNICPPKLPANPAGSGNALDLPPIPGKPSWKPARSYLTRPLPIFPPSLSWPAAFQPSLNKPNYRRDVDWSQIFNCALFDQDCP